MFPLYIIPTSPDSPHAHFCSLQNKSVQSDAIRLHFVIRSFRPCLFFCFFCFFLPCFVFAFFVYFSRCGKARTAPPENIKPAIRTLLFTITYNSRGGVGKKVKKNKKKLKKKGRKYLQTEENVIKSIMKKVYRYNFFCLFTFSLRRIAGIVLKQFLHSVFGEKRKGRKKNRAILKKEVKIE